jgi:2-polyprenyl-6-methoxyphenol hydroxylase-like FAD-dependent oxidoreductase
MSDHSVVIVGAGTVGLATALGLAQAGARVTVLEAATGPVSAPRDNVYHWSVMPEFDRLGILGEVMANGMISRGWAYRVLRTGETITFEMDLLADELEYPFNVHLAQGAMTAILLANIERLPDTEVAWGTRASAVAQDAAGVTVMAEGPDGARTYRAGWVVGADGASSIVRHELGFALAGSTWPERFVASDLRYDFSTLGFRSAGYQVDYEHGAVVARVDESGLWRYIHAESRLLPEHTAAERVAANLASVIPDGSGVQVEQSLPYRIHERSVDRFRSGRMLLVGDAAHLTNPVASCGMTSGLFDSFAAVEALAAVINREATEDVLDHYSSMRRRNFREFASPYSSAVKEFVFSTGDPGRMADEVKKYRDIVADPDQAREYVRMTGGCRSPSVLASQTRDF